MSTSGQMRPLFVLSWCEPCFRSLPSARLSSQSQCLFPGPRHCGSRWRRCCRSLWIGNFRRHRSWSGSHSVHWVQSRWHWLRLRIGSRCASPSGHSVRLLWIERCPHRERLTWCLSFR
jgi:hypothetical protein